MIALLIGGAVALYEFEELDETVVALGASTAQNFVSEHAGLLAAGQGDEIEPHLGQLLDEGFAIVEIYGADKKLLAEVEGNPEQAELIESAGKEAHSFPETAEPIYDKLFIDGEIFIQVLVPFLQADGSKAGFFEGVYHVDAATTSAIKAQVIKSIALAVIVVLVTSMLLYPVIVMLNRRLMKYSRQLLRSNLQVLEVLGNAVAKRDSDTDVHNYRVTLYSVKIAEVLGLDNADIQRLIKGAFLHDVGKIGISDNILLKPGKLTDEEFNTMKTHVELGLDIISPTEWLNDARDVVQYHHEKFSGGGYMAGLAGEDIPILARIFAVADVFDALVSQRPYKDPMPLGKALSILEEGRGNHFDPAILDAFLPNAERWLAWMNSHDAETVRENMRDQVESYFGL